MKEEEEALCGYGAAWYSWVELLQAVYCATCTFVGWDQSDYGTATVCCDTAPFPSPFPGFIIEEERLGSDRNSPKRERANFLGTVLLNEGSHDNLKSTLGIFTAKHTALAQRVHARIVCV